MRCPFPLILFFVFLVSRQALGQTTNAGPRVVPVYLVPSDLSLSAERLALTVRALKSVREWYQRVLAGQTFDYDPVVVQVSRHSFSEFAADSFQAWWPLLQEEFKNYGLDWEDDNTKMLWVANGAGAWAGSDSENGGIDSIAEAGQVPDGDRGGLAVVGDSSLGGYLAGVCPDSGRTGTAWWCSWKTFQGTLAHELGHTWGLPHPDAFLPGFRCADSTAWTNMQCHWGFPFDSLLPYEQRHLKSLRHFRDRRPRQYRMLTGIEGLRGRITPTDFEKNGSLLWMDGRGGGTGYLWGLRVHRVLRVQLGPGVWVADLGLPRGAQAPVSVSIRLNGIEVYQRNLSVDDPPLSIAIPLNRHKTISVVGSGEFALGNPRWYCGSP